MSESLKSLKSRCKRWGAAQAYFFYNHVFGRLPGYEARRFYLNVILGFRIGEGVAMHMGAFVTGRKIAIGTRSVINRGCYLDGRGGLTIGQDVSISPQCYLLTLTHDPQDPAFGAIAKPVSIEDRAWLGARVIVLPGVLIGEGAIVGAGSVVTRNVEPFSIVAGNPARKIGERNRNLEYQLGYFPYFDTDIQPG